MSKETAMAALTGESVPQATQTPPTSVPTSDTQAPPTSGAFSQLAKKEAEIVRQRNEVKKQQETLTAEKERLSVMAQKYQEYETTKSKDPIAAMKLLGFSEQDVFNYMAQQQPEELTPEQKGVQAAEQAAMAKIKEFEDNQTKKEKEIQARQDQGLIQGFKSDITQQIKNNVDQFEYCNYYGPIAEELAFETVLEVLKESQGKDIMTAEEALKEVETYYEEQDQLMSRLKKRQPKTNIAVPAQKEAPTRTRTLSSPTPPVADTPKPTIHKSRTLTNGTTATMASTRHKMNESREEKRSRLIEALKNGAI